MEWWGSSYAFGQLWTPAQITTALWLDATDASTITQLSNLVSQINDKSGNARNFTASAGARPTLTQNALNELPELSFSGSQWLTSASAASVWAFLHGTTGSSVFTLWKPGIMSNPNTLYGFMGNNAASSASIGLSLWYDDRATQSRDNRISTFITTTGSNWVVNTTTADNFSTPNQYQVFGWVLNPGATPASARSSVRVNGGTASQTNTDLSAPTSSNPTNVLQIGALGNNSFPLIGGVIEIVIVTGVISDINRQKIEGYMTWRGGLSSSLPADHPYKSAPPTI